MSVASHTSHLSTRISSEFIHNFLQYTADKQADQHIKAKT